MDPTARPCAVGFSFLPGAIDDLREARDHAPPGIIDPRSSAYWNSRLGRYPAPSPPTRRLGWVGRHHTDRLRSVYDALHKCPSPRRAARGNDPKNGQRDIRHYLLLALAEVSGKPMVRMRLIVVAGLRRLAEVGHLLMSVQGAVPRQ